MKFEKFVKSAGTKGVLFRNDEGETFLYYDGCMMPVSDCCIAKATADMPDWMDIEAYGEYEAKLKDAILPYPDAKAKDILRIFGTEDDLDVMISQAHFALIESSDKVYVLTTDPGGTLDEVGLAVYRGFEEHERLVGVIFDKNYLERMTNNGN